ncbi:uncharacterized protein LOC117582129 [Drosophila guanche]|uniref:THAP-type domain-containing protein n=1 Tax=Drosophila guanche TaxID=7266 RepID=A0A3B0J9W9_DROGU|nr:uncharacterized protein LOC117582129 [Drosophila guanche]SPP79047.1 Hypothetical predicted protein [Drosophila guanche]
MEWVRPIVKCLVKGCSSHEQTFFVHKGNRQQWYANLGISGAPTRAKVCMKHFLAECFVNGRLRIGSLPTENLGHEPLHRPVFSRWQKRYRRRVKPEQKTERDNGEKNAEEEPLCKSRSVESPLSAESLALLEQAADAEFEKYIVEDEMSESGEPATHSESPENDECIIEDQLSDGSMEAASQSQSESSLVLYLQQRNNELQAEAECLRVENNQLRMENISLKKSFEIHKCFFE